MIGCCPEKLVVKVREKVRERETTVKVDNNVIYKIAL